MSENPRLFERLSRDGKDLVPVSYRFTSRYDDTGSVLRLAESDAYRAEGYCCWSFHKPISRSCVAGGAPADGGSENPPPDDQGASPRYDLMTGLPPSAQAGAFVLFANCLPVRGARRSVICDLQRGAFHFVPNSLYEILTDHRGKTIEAIKDIYENQYDQEIDEYFSFLLHHELGFFCSDPSSFPALDLSWDVPERITNAIIDVDGDSPHDYRKLFAELDDLGCKGLELRFLHSPALRDLESVLGAASRGRLRSIDLVVAYGEELSPPAMERFVERYPRLSSLIVYGAPQNLVAACRCAVTLTYVTQHVDPPSGCGKVHASFFATNVDSFTEAQKFNSCLNRKMSIDAGGEIRNCPSLPRSFGNARDVSLHSALAHRDFAALWEINKDQIEICKDCEFRYICTDCRAHLAAPGNLYSKPLKCTYDPYTAEWRLPEPG